MKKFLLILICVILVIPVFSFEASAGKSRYVFLRDGGTGDGSSYNKPVGTLADAYNALDLSKDCVIIICGDFKQTGHFSYGKTYTGSVRFTSNYNGVDYGKKYGAEYISTACRFVMWGETIFDDIDLKLSGNYFFIIANCYPITLTENFNPVYTKKVTGNAIDSGVSILGGFQNGQDMHELACYESININVLGGNNICIVAYNRSIKHGYHFGTANITVGGKAQVGTIRFASIDASDIIGGNVNITVKDSAQVNYIRSGNKTNIDVNSVIVNWEGGKIGEFIPAETIKVGDVEVLNTEFAEGCHLRYSKTVEKSKDFKKISESFDHAVLIGSSEDNFVPTVEEKPADLISDIGADATVEVVTEEVIAEAETTHEITWATHDDFVEIYEDDPASIQNIVIISACGVISVCAIIIILLLRKK